MLKRPVALLCSLSMLAACQGGEPGIVTPLAAPAAAVLAASPAAPAAAMPAPSAAPALDHAAAFPPDAVQAMRLTIAPADWRAMVDHLASQLGPRGPDRSATGARSGAAETPIWVPATVSLGERTWSHVGVRFKGHSTLLIGWGGGTDVLPFKLDFDQFEDRFPETRNQRFFGFKQLALSTNLADDTGLRESLATEIMRAAGVIAPRVAPCALTLDRGEGPALLGLYALTEVADDTVAAGALGPGGELYEAIAGGANLAAGSVALLRRGFEKKTNRKADDWRGLEALHAQLHDPRRTADAAAWRAGLARTFDVDAFLRWLAVATVIGHTDTYGHVAHNFYLASDAHGGPLTWISWDHGLVLGRAGGPGQAGWPEQAQVDATWPLIRFLLDDPVYGQAYHRHLVAVRDGAFSPAATDAAIGRLARAVAPVAEQLGRRVSFERALNRLRGQVAERQAALASFLAARPR